MSNATVPPFDDCAIVDLREIWALADEMNAVGFREIAEALIDLGRELADRTRPRRRAHSGRGGPQSLASTETVPAYV